MAHARRGCEELEAIEAELPQAQCGRCGYPTCSRYAQAVLVDGESISLCAPGGSVTRDALATLLGRSLPSEGTSADVFRVALVRDIDCIGCGKCADTCPVDAIVGARGLLYGVVSEWCTGCEICIPVCPTDCIELRPSQIGGDDAARKIRAQDARARYDAKQARPGVAEREGLRFAEPGQCNGRSLRDTVRAAVQRKQNRASAVPEAWDAVS